MQVIECGGKGRCGWLSLDYLLELDSELYLAQQIARGSVSSPVLLLALQELYANDTYVRKWMRANMGLPKKVTQKIRAQVAALLAEKSSCVEFNQAWGLAMVCTDHFRKHSLNLSLVDDQGHVHKYPVRNRTDSVYLYGGNGHWQAVRFS